MERLFLIGMRGAGKTTVVERTAALLGWEWCDADQVLEARFGKTIRRFFDDEGEAAFRAKEHVILAELCALPRHVIATGGGAVLDPGNRALLRTGRVVWLTADAGTLWQRLQADPATPDKRPDLAQGGLAEIEATLAARTSLYAGCADLTIDTNHMSPGEVAASIAAWMGASRGQR